MENAVNKIKKNLFLVLCMLFYSIIITAQNGTIVRGVVLDENDEPVIGANISIKGNKSIGTIADIDGNFQLKIPNTDAVLIVSFIGMTPQETPCSPAVRTTAPARTAPLWSCLTACSC